MEEFIKDKISTSDKIFTTGAYLQAYEIELNGVKQWRWIVVGQEENAFYNGTPITVFDYASSYQGLFQDE